MIFSIKHLMPKTLLKRSVLIIVVPLVMVQLISAYVFLDRHLDRVTRNVAGNLVSSIDLISALYHRRNPAMKMAVKKLGFEMKHHPEKELKGLAPKSTFDAWEDKFVQRALKDTLKNPHRFVSSEDILTVYVQIERDLVSFKLPRKRLMSRTTPLVFFWGFGASVFFLLIAILFMKNQVRPIKQLAAAVERFGKGMDISDFKPHGAKEVRQAALSFDRMRDRIKRQVEQRTEMLAGISHDLRTPLTRMKLELALLPKGTDVENLKKDIAHMEAMVNEYLEFVRGAQTEPTKQVNLSTLIKQSAKSFEAQDFPVALDLPKKSYAVVRPQGLKRVMDNLISNARRYAHGAWVQLEETDTAWQMSVDDNGPGIAKKNYEDVLKPFFRLESSRNKQTGGIGLGLSIVADIVASHGGKLTLGVSPYKGLRVVIQIPK